MSGSIPKIPPRAFVAPAPNRFSVETSPSRPRNCLTRESPLKASPKPLNISFPRKASPAPPAAKPAPPSNKRPRKAPAPPPTTLEPIDDPIPEPRFLANEECSTLFGSRNFLTVPKPAAMLLPTPAIAVGIAVTPR